MRLHPRTSQPKVSLLRMLPLLCAIALVTSCKGPQPRETGGAVSPRATQKAWKMREPDGEIKIGFLLPTFKQERWKRDQEAFEAKVRAVGATCLTAACEDSDQVQRQKTEDLLTQKIDVLVIVPTNSDTAGPLVDAAHKDGVPVIAYDRIINNADLDLYLTQDSRTVGVLQAVLAVMATDYKGNYVICSGQYGHSVAKAITEGNHEILDRYPDVHIVAEQWHEGWSTTLAQNTVENALTKYNNDIAAVLCNNSMMAAGAVEAVARQGLSGKVFIAGSDADLLNCQYIVQGKQAMDVFKAIKPLAERSAEIAAKIAKRELDLSQVKPDITTDNGFKPVPTIITPVYAFTKENLDKVVIESGYHRRDQVYGAGGGAS